MPKLTFEAWKREIDRIILAKFGLTSDDLPDCNYYDWWQDGVSAKSAAARAIKNAQ